MTGSRPARRARRLSANDWIDAASQAMVEHGVGAVAVEPLAERLGVTKESFYWHFPNRDSLLEAMLELWAQEETESAIAALDQIADLRQRLQELISRALTDDVHAGDAAGPQSRFGHAFSLAVSDAADDPVVQPIPRRASERRIGHLIACFRELSLRPDKARHRALFAYAAYRRHLTEMLMPPTGD